MLNDEIVVLTATAAGIGFVHTIFGPDHYLPFIVLSRARGWSVAKTIVITIICGLGHVGSSIILGFIGIALGVAVLKLNIIESFRGGIASWFLLAFGFTYFVWGLHRAVKNKPHTHLHPHGSGDLHSHTHSHSEEHSHIHEAKTTRLTPWILFTIFVFGPCEPLIPLIMYPAAEGSMLAVVIVAIVFGLITIGTMLSVVLLAYFGISRLPMHRFQRYAHALAGLAIFLCGVAVTFLGL